MLCLLFWTPYARMHARFYTYPYSYIHERIHSGNHIYAYIHMFIIHTYAGIHIHFYNSPDTCESTFILVDGNIYIIYNIYIYIYIYECIHSENSKLCARTLEQCAWSHLRKYIHIFAHIHTHTYRHIHTDIHILRSTHMHFATCCWESNKNELQNYICADRFPFCMRRTLLKPCIRFHFVLYIYIYNMHEIISVGLSNIHVSLRLRLCLR